MLHEARVSAAVALGITLVGPRLRAALTKVVCLLAEPATHERIVNPGCPAKLAQRRQRRRRFGLGASVSGYQARTSITELSVPCRFKTFSRASRSGIHSPSRKNLYS